MKKQTLLIITALLLLCANVTNADVYIRPKYVKCELNNGAYSPVGQDASKLVDNETTDFGTKWYAYGFSSGHIVVNARKKIRINALILNNGYDTSDIPNRRWMNFKIYGQNDNKQWEEIHSFTNQNFSANRSPYIFLPLYSEYAYQMYKVEILSVMGGGEMQMAPRYHNEEPQPTNQLSKHIMMLNYPLSESVLLYFCTFHFIFS